MDNNQEYEEYMKILEKEADDFLAGFEEFEDIDDEERSFRFEYAFEGLTEKCSRFRKNVAY